MVYRKTEIFDIYALIWYSATTVNHIDKLQLLFGRKRGLTEFRNFGNIVPENNKTNFIVPSFIWYGAPQRRFVKIHLDKFSYADSPYGITRLYCSKIEYYFDK